MNDTLEHQPAPRRRRRALWATAALVPALVAGGAVAAHAHKTVEIEIDGESHSVSTWRGSVAGLLEDEGLDLGPHDLVAPATETALSDGAEVVVRHAQEVTVSLDGEEHEVWTTALTQAELLASFFDSGRDASISASRSADRGAVELPLVEDGDVVVAVGEERERVRLDGEVSVAEALEAAEVEVGRQDRVEVSADADTAGAGGNVIVEVTPVVHDEETETREVEPETVRRADDSLYEGEERVLEEGSAGERRLTYATITVGGQETTRVLIEDEVTSEPEDRVIAYGTAERPAPEPEPEPEPAPGAGSGETGGGGQASAPEPTPEPEPESSVPGDVWAALAQCESGGNPTTNTGNGYYGMYQFSLPTWQSVGGTGLPSEASAAEQTQRAQILQQRAGWGQWPACARSLGLL